MTKPCYLNRTEVLFGFVAFLTTREDAITFGSSHLTPPCMDVMKVFMEANDIDINDISSEWPDNLIMPSC